MDVADLETGFFPTCVRRGVMGGPIRIMPNRAFRPES